ncbi:LOW QUALITY PROTEIN: hypothetical protein SBY92_000713 [Candida maltosa Xu316]
MKFTNSAILLGLQLQVALASTLNTIDTFHFDEVTSYKCWKFDSIHGETNLKLDISGINANQELPINVHKNVESMHLDKDKGQEDFTIQKDAFTVFETDIYQDGKLEVLIDEPGEFCVSFNENGQYQGSFQGDLEIVEKIAPIRVNQEAYNHGITAFIGVLIIAGLYKITSFNDISPISQRLLSLLALHLVYNLTLSILEWYCYKFPSSSNYLWVENYFINIVGSILTCWSTYVNIMIYFGSGFKNLGYKAPSNTSWIKKTILASLVTAITVSTSMLSNSIVKKQIVIDGHIQDVYMHSSTGPFIKNTFLSKIFGGIISVLGLALLICVTVLPFIYGFIIYNRFSKSGEYVNQQLMKKTILYHGVYAWGIGSLFYYFFDFMKLFEEYVPVVILFTIWYSERGYVALKGVGNDLGGIKDFYL